MNAAGHIEADLLRVRRQLREVQNPDMATMLRAKLAMLEHRLETVKAISGH